MLIICLLASVLNYWRIYIYTNIATCYWKTNEFRIDKIREINELDSIIFGFSCPTRWSFCVLAIHVKIIYNVNNVYFDVVPKKNTIPTRSIQCIPTSRLLLLINGLQTKHYKY